MRRVIVDMQNALFGDAISTALKNFSSDFHVYQSESPKKTVELCSCTQADILIMEVTAYMPWKLADRVRQAKKDGKIDNFIYGSVSATYLSAVIDVL